MKLNKSVVTDMYAGRMRPHLKNWPNITICINTKRTGTNKLYAISHATVFPRLQAPSQHNSRQTHLCMKQVHR